jgi:transmembrane sensor
MSAPAPSLSDRIDEQAARWTARLDGGKMTPADRLALHAWLDEDPAHRAAFEHYQLICDDTAESLPVIAQVSPVARPDAAPRRRLHPWPMLAGLAAALALVAFWGVPWFRDIHTVATAIAQRSTLSLPDGSRAELNARTTLHTDFRRGRRFVRLERGEAYFSVAKDAAHPFAVETPGGTVLVTGTEFNVRLDAAGHPEVTLLDGTVNFENAAARVRLVPGQQVTAAGELRSVPPAELGNVTAWRSGRLVLNGLTLAAAAARFADFHGVTIAIDPGLESLQLGGNCSLEDLPGFLDTLSADNIGLRVLRRDTDNYAIVRK